MREYSIKVEKIQSSLLSVPAKNKKEAIKRAERLIEDVVKDKIDVDRLISWNPEYTIKVKKSSTQRSAFFIGGKKKWFLKL